MVNQSYGYGREAIDVLYAACDEVIRNDKGLCDKFVKYVEDTLNRLKVDQPLNSRKGLQQLKAVVEQKAIGMRNKAQKKTLKNFCDLLGGLIDLASTAASTCFPIAIVVGGLFVLLSVYNGPVLNMIKLDNMN